MPEGRQPAHWSSSLTLFYRIAAGAWLCVMALGWTLAFQNVHVTLLEMAFVSVPGTALTIWGLFLSDVDFDGNALRVSCLIRRARLPLERIEYANDLPFFPRPVLLKVRDRPPISRYVLFVPRMETHNTFAHPDIPELEPYWKTETGEQ